MNFGCEFIFYDHYINERVIELNHAREFMFFVLSESGCKHGDTCIIVMSILDEFSLKVMDDHVNNIEHDKSNLRVAFSQMLCPEI